MNEALTSKRSEAIAFALISIFSVIGVPCILQVCGGSTHLV